MSGFTCKHGLAPDHIARAVDLYWQAFGPKLSKVMGPEAKARAFFTRVFDPNHAISALGPDGDLWGVAGFKSDNGALTAAEWSDMTAIYGSIDSTWRVPLLSLLERTHSPDILTMDGIFVSEQARGQGVGTVLLDAIVQTAKDLGKTAVRLDVIDTNPRARALYERRGFVATTQEHLGPFKWLFGFASATTMIRDV
ncbi:MAG: GNAT family N-acetyltransferase [Ascidiaceihabitans sp.]|nr:GNAT family N-acetyltransferase [Ascidiaceihabitans sp.]